MGLLTNLLLAQYNCHFEFLRITQHFHEYFLVCTESSKTTTGLIFTEESWITCFQIETLFVFAYIC